MSLEKTRQKARVYYQAFHILVFSFVSGLYFENVLENIQQGIHVGTVDGKCLTDKKCLPIMLIL